MATPFARAATGSLESQLLLAQMKRQQEQQRLQAMQQIGQSVGSGLQGGISSITGAIDRHQERQQQAAQFAEKLGLQRKQSEEANALTARGQDVTARGQDLSRANATDRLTAEQRAAERRAQQADFARRLKALPDLAVTNLSQAQGVADQRVLQAKNAAEGPLPQGELDVNVADFRAALERDGFKTQGIDDATMRSSMNLARQKLEDGTLELDAERKKYMDALKGVRLAENERVRLADNTLALAKMEAIKKGAMELPKEDRDLMRETMDLFIRKKVRMVPSASLSTNVASGFSALSAGANAAVGASGSTGQHDAEAEANAKLEARWTKLKESKSWAWLQKVDTFNRAYAKASEPRLTDADWNWYEEHLLAPYRGEDLFAERFNDLASELHGKLKLDVDSIANVGADGTARADVPVVFSSAVQNLDPAVIGFTPEDRKRFSGKWKKADEGAVAPVGEALSKAQKAMTGSIPTFTKTVETEVQKQANRIGDPDISDRPAVAADRLEELANNPKIKWTGEQRAALRARAKQARAGAIPPHEIEKIIENFAKPPVSEEERRMQRWRQLTGRE